MTYHQTNVAQGIRVNMSRSKGAKMVGLKLVVGLAFALVSGIVSAEDVKIICPKNPPEPPKVARSDVYKDVPFKSGEVAEYELRYMGALAGYGKLEVRPPQLFNDRWMRSFFVDAKTGDWYKLIFVAHDTVSALSRPWDFGIAKFYMSQDEGKMFGSRFSQDKWLEFDHKKCKTYERVTQPGKKEDRQEFDLQPGAIDALGAAFWLRIRDYKLNKTERAPIYTSEKNWYLDATPVAFEKLNVPAGEFETVKLKLQTFLGKELQQKGDVYVWIATKTPQKQLVKIEGDIKIGSVKLILNKYQAGN